MKLSHYTFLVLVVPLLAATQWSPVPDEHLDGISYSPSHSVTMTVFGQAYSWEVTDEDLSSTPSWDASSGAEPPLSLPEAIAVSEAQLGRYFPEVPEWVLETITLERLGWAGNWFYIIEWKAKRHHEGDYLGIPVLMSGQAVYLEKQE